MPISYSVDRARRRISALAEGPVGYADIVLHVERQRDEGILPLHELLDASGATAAFAAPEVRRLVELVRSLAGRHALGPVAVVVGNDLAYGLMRMLGILVEDLCDIRPFRDRAEAEAWLDAIPAPRPPSGPADPGRS